MVLHGRSYSTNTHRCFQSKVGGGGGGGGGFFWNIQLVSAIHSHSSRRSVMLLVIHVSQEITIRKNGSKISSQCMATRDDPVLKG